MAYDKILNETAGKGKVRSSNFLSELFQKKPKTGMATAKAKTTTTVASTPVGKALVKPTQELSLVDKNTGGEKVVASTKNTIVKKMDKIDDELFGFDVAQEMVRCSNSRAIAGIYLY